MAFSLKTLMLLDNALHVNKILREDMGLSDALTMYEAHEVCQQFDLEGRMFHIQRNSARMYETSDLAWYIARRTTGVST